MKSLMSKVDVMHDHTSKDGQPQLPKNCVMFLKKKQPRMEYHWVKQISRNHVCYPKESVKQLVTMKCLKTPCIRQHATLEVVHPAWCHAHCVHTWMISRCSDAPCHVHVCNMCCFTKLADSTAAVQQMHDIRLQPMLYIADIACLKSMFLLLSTRTCNLVITMPLNAHGTQGMLFLDMIGSTCCMA